MAAEAETPRAEFPQELAESLNKPFYAAEPHMYLIQRLANLLVVKNSGEQLEALIPDEFHLGELSLKRQNVLSAEDRRWRFLMTESEVVLHHVCETALRLYIAHADAPAVLWAAVAQEFRYWKFKKDVAGLCQRLLAGEERDRIHAVFHGGTSRKTLGPEPPSAEKWDSAAENIADFLALFASIFLDAGPYNAATHGLAIAAGRSCLQVEIDGEEIMWAEGETLDCLTIEGKGGVQWAVETRWLVPDYAIALGIAGCHLIQLLWLVGRTRYLGEDAKLQYLFDRPTLEENGRGHGDDPRGRRMTRRIIPQPPRVLSQPTLTRPTRYFYGLAGSL